MEMTDQALVDELVGNAHGNLARVTEILGEHPELINVPAVWKETPVEAATQMGNRAIIEYLVSRGAPVDFFTSLVLAQLEKVRTELRAKPELAQARGVHDLPVLYFAVMGGSREMVRFLIESGADPSLADYKGRDARALATEMGRSDLASLIPTPA